MVHKPSRRSVGLSLMASSGSEMVGVSALWDMAHMREKVGMNKSPGLVCRGVELIPSVGILKIYRRIAPMSTLHLDFLDHPPVTLAGPQPQPSAPAPVRKPEPAAPLRLTDDQMDAASVPPSRWSGSTAGRSSRRSPASCKAKRSATVSSHASVRGCSVSGLCRERRRTGSVNGNAWGAARIIETPG